MVKENIKQVKDQGKLFERLSSDHDVGSLIEKNKIFLSTFLFAFFKLCNGTPTLRNQKVRKTVDVFVFQVFSEAKRKFSASVDRNRTSKSSYFFEFASTDRRTLFARISTRSTKIRSSTRHFTDCIDVCYLRERIE